METEPTELAVVIPVYNEQSVIRQVLETWLAELNKLGMQFQIHAYSDGAQDRSPAIMRELAEREPRLTVHEKPNSGHGPTVLLGYRRHADAMWVFQVDSDDELPADRFATLWEERAGHDFLVGYRVNRVSSPARRFVSWTARFLLRLLFGRNTIRDVNVPFRLMRSSAFAQCWAAIPADTFAPNVLISGYAAQHRLRHFEIPVTYRQRTAPAMRPLQRWRLLHVAFKAARQTLTFRRCSARA